MESPEQDIVFKPLADHEPTSVVLLVCLYKLSFLIGEHCHNHLRDMTEMYDRIRQVHPACHIVRGCHAQHALVSSQCAFAVLQTETQEQVSQDGLLRLTFKT